MMEKEPVKTGAGELADDHSGTRDDLQASTEPSTRARTPEALRALAEAEQRRNAARRRANAETKELGGQDGPEPTRYGDWEKGGILSDF